MQERSHIGLLYLRSIPCALFLFSTRNLFDLLNQFGMLGAGHKVHTDKWLQQPSELESMSDTADLINRLMQHELVAPSSPTTDLSTPSAAEWVAICSALSRTIHALYACRESDLRQVTEHSGAYFGLGL